MESSTPIAAAVVASPIQKLWPANWSDLIPTSSSAFLWLAGGHLRIRIRGDGPSLLLPGKRGLQILGRGLI